MQFTYLKTFREHKGAEVVKDWQRILWFVYRFTLKWTYNLCLFLLGLPTVLIWGVVMAVVACFQTWFLSPFSRVLVVLMRSILLIVQDPAIRMLREWHGACKGSKEDDELSEED